MPANERGLFLNKRVKNAKRKNVYLFVFFFLQIYPGELHETVIQHLCVCYTQWRI